MEIHDRSDEETPCTYAGIQLNADLCESVGLIDQIVDTEFAMLVSPDPVRLPELRWPDEKASQDESPDPDGIRNIIDGRKKADRTDDVERAAYHGAYNIDADYLIIGKGKELYHVDR